MRLLFVDDNARMRRFLMSLVGNLLTDAREAANGLEAVEEYKSFHPDAVLMDIRMPLLDGFEATTRIMHENPDARILIVTDFDTPEYRLLAKRAGASGYIVKDHLFDLPSALKALAS
ncbi:response regulator [bacterium]|nr:response regulator [bacterium]